MDEMGKVSAKLPKNLYFVSPQLHAGRKSEKQRQARCECV